MTRASARATRDDKAAAGRSERAAGLRAVYAAVFAGIAAIGLASAWAEAAHLFFALTHTANFGEPPRPVAVFGVALVLVTVVAIATMLVRGREIPLWLSALVLLGTALCLVGTAGGLPEGRSWAAADTAILKVGSKVQREMVDVLQTDGKVPTSNEAWQNVLKLATNEPSPARTRFFRPLPYVLRLVPDEDAPVPDDVHPGELLVWVAPQGEAFRIRLVGFDREGKVAPLTDDKGKEVVLSGTFNPDLGNAPAGLPGVHP